MMGTPDALATLPTWYTAVACPRPTAHTWYNITGSSSLAIWLELQHESVSTLVYDAGKPPQMMSLRKAKEGVVSLLGVTG